MKKGEEIKRTKEKLQKLKATQDVAHYKFL